MQKQDFFDNGNVSCMGGKSSSSMVSKMRDIKKLPFQFKDNRLKIFKIDYNARIVKTGS